MNPSQRSITRCAALLTLGTALFALGNFSAQAQSQPPILLFTELSDTSLTATINGVPFGTVTMVQPDQWNWTSGITQIASDGSAGSGNLWPEPNGETTLNRISFIPFNYGLQITSDLAVAGLRATVADGAV